MFLIFAAKPVSTVFLTMLAVLKVFRMQEKPAYTFFFTFQNISKFTTVFKNCKQAFLSYAKY